jgi:hypothetical protein
MTASSTPSNSRCTRMVPMVATAALLITALVGCVSSTQSESSAPVPHPESGSADVVASDPPSPPASPAQSSASSAAGPEWEVATFGNPGLLAFAYDVVASPSGLVAVGVLYDGHLPIVGPAPPHDGRIWISAGGGSWQDVTPRELFTNVSLYDIYVRADGSLVALGTISEHTQNSGPHAVDAIAPGAWESGDGRTWQPTATGLPEGASIWQVNNGERGYLARISPPGAIHGSELWFSADGRAWERVRTLLDGSVAIGAGDDGFVVVGTQGDRLSGEPPLPFALASADGREWFESPDPPPEITTHVAPIGGDWLAISYAFGDESRSAEITSWFSANGLDWTPNGGFTMASVEAGVAVCHEFPTSLSPAAGWLVVGSTIGGLACGEGGQVTHGTQRISSDGASWSALPFVPGTVGISNSGSQVYGAATDDARLVLVGQMDSLAALWTLPLR